MSPKTQDFSVNFSGQPDTKTDPFRVAPTDFLAFNNSVRTVGGRFTKRNGYQNLATFSAPFATNLAIFSGGLLGIGDSVQLYSPETGTTFNRGGFQPIGLSVIPAIRNSATQSTADVAISSSGLACVVAKDSQSGVVYQIIEAATGNVVLPIQSIAGASTARVYLLGSYFVITYYDGSGLSYKAIPVASPTTSPTTGVIAASIQSSAYDAFSFNNVLYIAWNSTDNSGNSYRINTLSSSLVLGTSVVTNSLAPTQISVTVDTISGNPAMWVMLSNWNSGTTTATVTVAVFDGTLTPILGNTTFFATSSFSSNPLSGISCVASGQRLTGIVCLFSDGNFLLSGTITSAAVVVTPVKFLNNLTIASRPFISFSDGNVYMLAFFVSPTTVNYQPTYFMVDSNGTIVGKLAYSNGGAADLFVYSSVNQSSDGLTVQIAYLFQDLLVAVNKDNGAQPGGLYNQSGVNISTFTFNESNIVTAEIGGSLQMSGGFLWMYDGERAVENNFHVWPQIISANASSSGGLIDSADQPFFYVATYEWTDASGKIHRSAPSIPVEVSGLSGSSNKITVTILSLGLTAKVAPNPVRLVFYRWSTTNQVYYQVSSVDSTSGTNPMIINDQSVFTQSFVDKLDDSSIVGNNILYTTGGVLEDLGGPASQIMALFDTRLWLVDAEDPNLLWLSKEVIESTPIEMTDALTFFVAPTTASQESTGPITGLAAMDDKLIIFKKNTIYYINGSGPDNTGANNNYSQPIFITAAVGCSNQKSIVLTPVGLMFQTGQGIWLLDRSLETSYIGAPMEVYNYFTVTSAISIPNATQIRFTLSNGTELVYDYFYQKWDTCTPPTAISSVVYQGLHTFLDASGNIWQENAGSYVDSSTPVNLSFTTPWYNLAGLQGYERVYEAYLLGTYLSPHILTVQVYYDYSTTVSQTFTFNPNGLNPNGGASNTLEQFRILFQNQKCQAVKFSVTEGFDSTFGGTAGAGLTLSGINFVLGIKKSYKPIATAQSSG